MRNNLLVLFILSAFFANAQNRCSYIPLKEAENLIFQPGVGITANSDGEIVFTPNGVMDDPGKGSAAISDKEGNLLFFTNGMTVWNSNFNVMAKGSGLKGNLGCTQPAVIVPQPDDEGVYFVFTTDIINKYIGTNGLNYSKIDMSKSNGLGEVISKNTQLKASCTEKITAVKKSNGTDYWVMAHGWKNNEFYLYEVTNEGVALSKTIEIGSVHDYLGTVTTEPVNTSGYMKFSPDGSKLALAILGDGIVEIFDFNNETGSLSNPIPLSDENYFTGANGIEFSPNSKYLYVTSVGELADQHDNKLLQIDLSDNSIEDLSASLPDLQKDATSVQLTAGRKIIVSGHGKTFLGIINNPDRDKCNFIHDYISINAISGVKCLTNFCTSFLDMPPFLFDTKCFNDETVFEIINASNSTEIIWDFDDASGTSDLSDLENPIHVFSEPGNYTVSLTLKDDAGDSYEYERLVTIDSLPEPDLGATKYLLPNASTLLDPGEFYGYAWQLSGSEERIEIAAEEGTFIVEVENDKCCKKSTEVDVVIVKLSIPTAFKPSSAIEKNKKFTIASHIEGINDYKLFVYNRWGQEVFSSEDMNNSWNGTYNGENCAKGAYAYVMSFTIIDEKQNQKEISRKGQVILVR
ncbi:MAG: gliding motility-associated C-terminal domain-containing protein [Bacteroidota bacterium]|nr:gliding motility-associated C-terminal domain-containing protein [Bacteroidota bacterium]